MSTVFDGVGKPIINNNGDWVKYSSFSSSSTVVLDPAAFLDNWKKQIQGKHNIPVHQQRLTFACNHSPVSGVNLFSWSSTSEDQTAHVPVVGDFVTCLQSWQAIFLSKKRKKHNIARLVNPEVLTESDKLPSDLKSKAAEEFRSLGIPCSVYYLSFDKWIVTTLHSQNCQGTTQHCKELSSLCIRVDDDFQQTEFEVNLYGRLSKSSQSLHFSYNLNGRHIAAHMSMREQTALYREGQKARHSLGKRNAYIEKAVDGSPVESLLEVNKTSTVLKQGSGQGYYYIPGSKDQELIAVIKNCELTCIVLPVIILDGPWERRPTLMCPLSSPKTPECAKQKGLISSKLTKTRGGGILDSQASNSPQKLSLGSFRTDNSSASSSVKQYTVSSKSNELKKPSKKKRKKKGKRNLKNIDSDTSALPPEDTAQKNILSSNVNEVRVHASEQISICESLQDAVLFDTSKENYRNQNDVKFGETKLFRTVPKDANDPEVHTTPKGEITDTHCSCISDLSNENSALQPRENSSSGTLKSEKHNYNRQDSLDDVSASAQNTTSIDLIGRTVPQLPENGDKNNNHTIESIEAIETSTIHTSISGCNLVMHCNDLLSTNDGQCSSQSVSEAFSPDVEFKKKARVILKSIISSYHYQVASENIAHEFGSPLAEFEKVLYSVSPVIEPVPCLYRCGTHSRNHGVTNLACRCEIADVPLENIWSWFQRPSNYGLEVKAEDFQCSDRLGIGQNLFLAYFVPSLSGIQLFNFSDTSQSCCKGAKRSAWQEKNEEMESAKDFHLPQCGNLHIDTGVPVCSSSMDGSNLSSNDRNHSCSTWPEDLTHGNLEILFEYYESEPPPKRKPILEKIRELIKCGSGPGSKIVGDPHILESGRLQDLHPASWFSVAWYPIYRIPEGPLRAAFLTYHSLGHFVHRSTSSIAIDRDVVDCIVTPVVGLESYNTQAECWFIPKHFQFSSEENLPYNPMVVMTERLRTLQETASSMSRDCTKEGTVLACSKHKDYEFFLKRKR